MSYNRVSCSTIPQHFFVIKDEISRKRSLLSPFFLSLTPRLEWTKKERWALSFVWTRLHPGDMVWDSLPDPGSDYTGDSPRTSCPTVKVDRQHTRQHTGEGPPDPTGGEVVEGSRKGSTTRSRVTTGALSYVLGLG